MRIHFSRIVPAQLKTGLRDSALSERRAAEESEARLTGCATVDLGNFRSRKEDPGPLRNPGSSASRHDVCPEHDAETCVAVFGIHHARKAQWQTLTFFTMTPYGVSMMRLRQQP